MNEKAPSASELREKYQALLAENSSLREEITLLKARLGDEAVVVSPERSYGVEKVAEATSFAQTMELSFPSEVNSRSEAGEKIRLFMVKPVELPIASSGSSSTYAALAAIG